ncbi:MAG: DNA primase [Anaplasmataceae bacterium]|nr:DNA primase [Anaplasmataceae bacterium]
MANSPAEEIKQKLDIVEFLRGYLEVQPAGRNFKARCPFHREKTPSFMISPDRQSWRCFGCGLGGDVFTFVMQHEHVDFSDALRILAEKSGVELRRISSSEYNEQAALYEVVEAAKNFYASELKKSAEARKYLEERGLDEETINVFELGWSPPGTEHLTQHLLKKGYQPEILIRSGMSLRNQSGLLTDRFRGRIMFPLHNHIGKVVGFTGRLLPKYDTGEMGKYVNTPETPIFSKSRLLYGFHESKKNIREAGEIIVVEGQMDFLALWQSGFRNVVASSGTALTLDHLKMIQRLTDNIVLTFDTDEAGQTAGERAIDLASQNDFNVKVVVLPPEVGQDPAEAALKNPEALKQSLQNGVAAMAFYFDRHLPQALHGASTKILPELKNQLRFVLSKLHNLVSAIEKEAWLKELSRRTGVAISTLQEELARLAEGGSVTRSYLEERELVSDNSMSQTMTRRELILLHLFAVALSGKKIDEVQKNLEYATPVYQDLYNHLQSGKATSSDPGLDEVLQAVFMRADRDFEEEEFQSLQTQLREEYLKERRSFLTRRIQEAEQAGDEEEVEKIMMELNASWNS